jgi:hypothetical protein
MAKPSLVYNPKITILNPTTGLPANGAKLFFYQPGTTTKINTYPTSADAIAGTNANSNPIVCNAYGQPSVDIYVTSSYKIVAAPSTDTDPPSNSYWTEDNISLLPQTMSSSAKSSNYTILVTDKDKLIKMDSSGGSKTINLIASASAGDGFVLYITKIDSSANTVTITPNGSEQIDGVNSSTTLSYQGEWIGLYNDGTQWFKISQKTHSFANPVSIVGNFSVTGNTSLTGTLTSTGNVSLTGSATSFIADGVTLGKIFYKEVTATFTTLATNAQVVVQASSGSQQYKVRRIMLSGAGTNFSGGGGDRLLKLTDGTSIYTVVPAASLQTLAASTWGATATPYPASAAHINTATAAGVNLYLQYSGGTADYTAGSCTFIVELEKTA